MSKQAARERFREFVELGRESFTPRLQRCIGHAGRLAQQAGASSIGTGHLLWALATSEGVAANVLVRLLALDRLEAAVKVSMPSDADSEVNRDLVESDQVRETLRAALRFAQQRGHTFVGTEHVLLCWPVIPDRWLTGSSPASGVSFADIKRELASNLTIQGKSRSLGERRTACLCPFCGKSDGSLVAGPGVWICADCTRIAAEVLANR